MAFDLPAHINRPLRIFTLVFSDLIYLRMASRQTAPVWRSAKTCMTALVWRSAKTCMTAKQTVQTTSTAVSQSEGETHAPSP